MLCTLQVKYLVRLALTSLIRGIVASVLYAVVHYCEVIITLKLWLCVMEYIVLLTCTCKKDISDNNEKGNMISTIARQSKNILSVVFSVHGCNQR